MKFWLCTPACLSLFIYAFTAANTTPTATQAADETDGSVPVENWSNEEKLISQEGEFVGIIQSAGADVIVGEMSGPRKWGTVGTVTSYSIGTTSCNIGTIPLQWIDGTPFHPVISQNIYRLKAGRFEQLGQGWMKWSFCALQGGVCGSCTPYCGGCCDHLGVGCSDPYTADRNGSQSLLGPKWVVNPTTGVFPQNHPTPGSGTLDGRIQINNDDLNPALNPGALFFGEGHYVSNDDATANNDNNNASYKRLNVGAFTGGGYALGFTGTITRQEPAINAWRAHGGGVGIVDPTVVLQDVDVSDGRFRVGYRVNQISGMPGWYHYEIAIFNINSDSSLRQVSVPVGTSPLMNIGFKDVSYHSAGMPYDLTDWPDNAGAGGLLDWSTTTFAGNPNANALRFGTMYNFRFDAKGPPIDRIWSLGRFKTADSVVMAGKGPASPGDMNCDGNVDILDINAFTLALADPAGYAATYPTCDILLGDLNNDGAADILDINPFVAAIGG
ncbi:hypothetical protein RAS1_04460 [Phycisphaerae bacterium RAS1]|nr:hypothetical protein RAS1_04460 [Phycisphaerae bacterium RAS1]